MTVVPELVLAHLSDPHFLHPSHPDAARTRARFAEVLAAIAHRQQPPAAIIVTGDLTQYGEVEAYADLRAEMDPAAAAMGAQVVWVPGNHDLRENLARELLGREADGPLFQVFDVDGLRIIGLDSLVPGLHYGELTEDHLERLRIELSTPAPRGTVLALHHPPLPAVLDFIQRFTLRTRDEFAAAIAGSDVRAVLTGHLHHSYFSTFAGVPVTTASSIGRPVDLTQPTAQVIDRDGPVLYNHIAVYPDVVTHAVVAVGEYAPLPNLRADV